MKKELVHLFSLILLFSVAFSSCKNDDDKLRTGVVYEKEALKLSVNGQVLTDRKAVISFLSSSEAQITLSQTIVGYENIVFTVNASENAGNTALNGNLTLDGAEYKIQGDVTSSDVMTLNITQKMTSPVVGKWYLQYANVVDPDWGFESQDPCVIASIKTDKTVLSFMGKNRTPFEVETFLKTILGGYVKSLDWIEFNENGNISLQFDLNAQSKDVVFPDGQILKEGDLKFYTKDKKVYLAVKATIIDLLLEGKVDFSKLPLEQTAGYYAMPMLYSQDNLKPSTAIDQGKNINIYVDKAMMQPMIVMMISLLDDKTNVGGIEIKPVMTDLNVIMSEAKSFDLGLIMAQNPLPAK